MKRLTNSGLFRTLILAAMFWLVCPQPVLALEYFIDTKPDMDSVRFTFDSQKLNPQVKRTGTQQITISFSRGALNDEKPPSPLRMSSMRILNAINIDSSNIVINTKTNAFGYIRIPAGNGELRLQFFRDPFGAKWAPPKRPEPAPKPSPKPAPKSQPVKAETPAKVGISDPPSTETGRQTFPELPAMFNRNESQTADRQNLSETNIPAASNTSGRSDQQRPASSQGEAPRPGSSQNTSSEARPFYSVPYAYRAPVANVGPGEAKAVSTAIDATQSVIPASDPVAGGAVSGPEAGGAVSGPVAGGAVSGPEAGGAVSGPEAGGAVSGPVAGGAVSGPVAGGAVSGPEAGGAVSGPEAGGAVSGPEAGGAVSGPEAGGVRMSIGAPQETSQQANTENPEATGSNNSLPSGTGSQTVTEAPVNSSESGITGTDSGVPPTSADAFPAEEIGSMEAETGANSPSLKERIDVAKGLILAAESALETGELEAALSGYTDVAAMHDLPKDLRLRALYGKAEATSETYKDDLAANFNKVISAWTEAMNADTNYPDVPDALLNLGLANLKVGNMPEAKAYFNLLKSQYPNNMNIPYISFYWGQYYLEKEDYANAADQFQFLIQKYPDSKVVREAALGLSKALNALGYHEQAAQILDYIDKRWPRFYIEYPDFLLMYANSENSLGNIADAKEHYWAFYNLQPDSDENDIVLARLGDIYLKEGDKIAAKEIYEKTVQDYPEEEGGLVAKMRLAEEGIYDDPSMAQMDKVFDRPYNLRPQKIYSSIVEDHPQSPLAPLAQLKLAMWYFWNKKYGECLGAVSDFVSKYPRSPLMPKAKELGFKVFDMAVPELVKDENYGKVTAFWDKYGNDNKNIEGISDDTRMGVALSYWKKGQPEKALKIADRYLKEKPVNKYSPMALDMALGIYVDDQSWSDVVSLVDMVNKNWKIDQRQQAQVQYAKAVAFENLGETEKSTPLWAGLASNLLLPSSSRAYAMYYMAKSAMKKKDLKKLFVYSQEALSMLLETGGDREKIKDSILMTIYSAESSGRYREALKWAAEYDKYIPQSDPEWASSRFRLAQLYEKAGAMPEWQKLMKEVADKQPDGLYGRLASSALETQRLENEASKFNSGLQ